MALALERLTIAAIIDPPERADHGAGEESAQKHGRLNLDFTATQKKVEALTAPRNVVIVGASDRPGSWAARVHRNLRRYHFPGRLMLINPGRQEVAGEPCYPDFKSLPEPPDHMVIMVPAPSVPALLREGAAAGARSATVFSSGFGEAFDEEGSRLGSELRAAIAETGIGVSGPNCMGNICSKASFVTLTEDRPLKLNQGPVALVGQSGGVMIFINSALEERGIRAEYLITSGNEAGLSVADYIAFFATQPELKVIITYVEALKDVERFKAACRFARDAGKYVVAIKLGQSEAGRSAAMAHTGSLAGSFEAFDALTGELGVIRAETLDDAIEVTELLAHTGAPKGPRLGAITLSGAYRGLLLDAAERNGLVFPKLADTTLERLNKLLGVGSLVSNPIDGGFGVLQSAETYLACIEAMQDDPNVDMVLLQEALPREPGSARGEKYIRMVEDFVRTKARKPISFVTLTSHSQTDFSRALRDEAEHVSFLQEANKALRAIKAVHRRSELEHLSRNTNQTGQQTSAQAQACAMVRAALGQSKEPVALNEARSKELLRAYGIQMPQEQLVTSPEAAVKASEAIGYPVVMKVVADHILHKSDIGGVILNLNSAESVRAAWQQITTNLALHGVSKPIDGMLIAQQVKSNLELVLGLNRDPEVGLVVMAGLGGVWLELIKDVAFAMTPVSAQKAADMLAQTHAGRLLQGYRGSPVLDSEAVVDAIKALGRIAQDLGDVLQSVDVNPFVVMPQGKGALALDGLVVLMPSKAES